MVQKGFRNILLYYWHVLYITWWRMCAQVRVSEETEDSFLELSLLPLLCLFLGWNQIIGLVLSDAFICWTIFPDFLMNIIFYYFINLSLIPPIIHSTFNLNIFFLFSVLVLDSLLTCMLVCITSLVRSTFPISQALLSFAFA